MAKAQPFRAKAGTVLFRPGDTCPGFVRLKSGTIRVSGVSPSGREIVLYRVGPGDVCLQTFSCLVDGADYSAEGLAETDLEGDIILPHGFETALAEDAEFRRDVLHAAARRFAELESQIERFAFEGLDRRLACTLLARMGEEQRISATQEDLAREAGSAREVISRKLAQWARAGWLEVRRGEVVVRDLAALRQLATHEV